jgi:Ni/Fe-hydrogenase 1 B-type cytochrome subunit
MSIIEPVREEIQHPKQIKKHSASLRLWHCANMIVISGSLITVLINSTLTDQRQTSVIMKEQFQKAGAGISNTQINSAAHALNDSVWNVHIYFGYALAGLLLFRLILEFFQLADKKFIRKIKSAYIQFHIIKKNRQIARHEFTVKLIYAFFYLLLIIMVMTGLSLAFKNSLSISKPLAHSIKQIHGFCMYLVLAFIVVHLAGVFLAERKDEKGIVSDMINGGSEISGGNL